MGVRLMHDDNELLPLVDSCRADATGQPAADDLAAAVSADPALAPQAQRLAHDPAAQNLFARAQRLDRQMQSAMVNVDVPAGLADRILSRLAEQAVGTESRVEQSQVEQSQVEQSQVELAPSVEPVSVGFGRHVRQRAWRRRYWLAAGLAAAAGLLFVISWYDSPVLYSPGMVLEAARQFDAAAPREPGKLLSESAPSQHFAISSRIVQSGEVRWRIVANFLGRKAVAFDLQTAAGVQATLYVARLGGLPTGPQIDARLLPTAPPRQPQPASGGDSMATWQEHGRLYVLVVHGDENAYRQLIEPESVIAGSFVRLPTPANS